MYIPDEDLVEYLRGGLPQDKREAVQRQLGIDNDLVERLHKLRRLLGQLDSLYGVYEPPADLVDATLARIDRASAGASSQSPGQSSATTPTICNAASRTDLVSFWDSTALTLSLIVLCCLLLPIIVRARFESRKAQCANNLRMTGAGLFDFALNDPHQRFPTVELDGPFSFAGVYAIRLKSFGVPLTPDQLRCASLLGMKQYQPAVEFDSIPTIWEFSKMAWDDQELKRAIGGDYAYNLGVMEGSAVVAPRYAARSGFAILADSPVIDGVKERFVAHDGRGFNMLYEDGRVVFVDAHFVEHGMQLVDHPFRNLRGMHAVGVIPPDAVLAPSHFSPLGAY